MFMNFKSLRKIKRMGKYQHLQNTFYISDSLLIILCISHLIRTIHFQVQYCANFLDEKTKTYINYAVFSGSQSYCSFIAINCPSVKTNNKYEKSWHCLKFVMRQTELFFPVILCPHFFFFYYQGKKFSISDFSTRDPQPPGHELVSVHGLLKTGLHCRK